MDAGQLKTAVDKLAKEIKAQMSDPENTLFVGIQQGGVVVADGIIQALQQLDPAMKIQYGQLDITFYRDDIRNAILAPDKMNLPFSIENKTVILIDDVLFTGRTIKAALDALLDYGRPAKVQLCVLVDRKEHRQFPIQADFTGITLETTKTDKIKLLNGEAVLLQ
ncbi:MAG: bifunctional pyr operon transcriptional regulator/uracil phosphoribosyltransferase PyrR [Chitinophagaceae bacterium]|nr:bifunctional pyr operon transcriptional regulator/uracil phosphoribosyltransferase PyrR [Chitinophagaceae bacterium]